MHLGWRLFLHSIRQVLLNLGPALRISLLPAALYLAIYLSIGQDALEAMVMIQVAPEQAENTGSALFGLGLLATVGAICFVWVAVAWHRYVLLEEEPGPYFARMQRGPMWAYVGASIRLFLLVFLIALGLVLIATLLSGIFFLMPLVGTALFLLTSVLIYGFVLGLSVILPSAALETPIRMAEARRVAWQNIGPVLTLSVLMSLLGGIPQFLAGTPLAPVVNSLAYQLPSQWLLSMLGISVATTLYGHFIEGRDLMA